MATQSINTARSPNDPWILYRKYRNLPLGITQEKGEEWKKYRTILNKLLIPGVVSTFVPRIDYVGTKLIDFIERNVTKDRELKNIPKLAHLYSYDAFTSILLGTKYDSLDEKNLHQELSEFMVALDDMFETTIKLLFKDFKWRFIGRLSPLLRKHFHSWDEIFRITPNLVDKRHLIERYNDGIKDFIDYIEEDKILTKIQRDTTIIEILGAGLDTTTAVIQVRTSMTNIVRYLFFV